VLDIVTIDTPSLGDRSYLVHDGRVAVAIDPQRDIDRFLAVLEALGVKLTHVLETHLHNDYVTGGFALAKQTGAAYVLGAAEKVSFPHQAAGDGERLTAGEMTITALHTPGHTANHMSYVVSTAGAPVAVFSGGSMLFGAVGRTDLMGDELTDELTRAQYRSVRRLAAQLPDEVTVHPTHGFGSFCSATPTSGDSSTMGEQRRNNIALNIDNEDLFVSKLLAGLGTYPRYYVHMAALNAAGPGAADLSPPAQLGAEAVRRSIAEGEWVVDLRERRAFAKLHVAGTVSIEVGDSFATYFGWTLPWQAPVTLVGDSAHQVAEARRQLARIGWDRLRGAAIGDMSQLGGPQLASYEVKKFEDLARAIGQEGTVVLDVRRPDEWEAGHIAGAVHIPFWEVAERVRELPDGQIWVHCAGGFRASIGASIVDRAGLRAVLVDDDWERAFLLGLPLECAR
jgi:hydroxyacylglutathione hydrolase